uniref:transcription factor E2F2-like n=1 Tax=Epinephelus lanceolatus TaxID=310571 RepID=UPI0014485BF5|nr:transcription factor E2F2-like [Epinephelus lanceolatus]
MMKCVVSGCPNRTVTGNRGLFHRPPKRFFSFPTDPARVKVWLAALRETDRQDATEQHIICEDHFLSEDISTSGVKSDAIPIMPPDLGGPLGLVSPWGAECSEEEEEEWAAGDCEEEEDEDEDDAPPATHPPQQDPGGRLENPPEAATTSSLLQQRRRSESNRDGRQNVSLGLLTLRFLQLLLAAPDGALDLRDVPASLNTRKRRVYDITHVLSGFNLIKKDSANWIKWIGKSPISSFLWKNPQRLQSELENLKVVEDKLDGLIKSCAQQLFDMTDDVESSASAYVTYADISRLRSIQQQTVIIVKAPEETQLEIPAPQEDHIQMHLKAGRTPITVLTCELGSAERSGSFLTLEESRVRTTTLCTGSPGAQRV